MSNIYYSRSGDFVEIIVHDYSGRKLESLNCNVQDKKKYKNILEYLKDKYGFEPLVESPETDIKEDKIDWLA